MRISFEVVKFYAPAPLVPLGVTPLLGSYGSAEPVLPRYQGEGRSIPARRGIVQQGNQALALQPRWHLRSAQIYQRGKDIDEFHDARAGLTHGFPPRVDDDQRRVGGWL